MEHNHGGLVQIIFLSKWVICRFQPLIFQGVGVFSHNPNKNTGPPAPRLQEWEHIDGEDPLSGRVTTQEAQCLDKKTTNKNGRKLTWTLLRAYFKALLSNGSYMGRIC